MSRRMRAIVEVFPDSALPERPRLFAALAQALPVTFRPYSGSRGEADALIILTDGPGFQWDRSLRRGDIPVLVVGGDPAAAGPREEIRLHRVAELDPTLRGISLHDRPVAPPPSPTAGETVLATAPTGPVWTVSGGPAPIHQVRSVLSELEADHVLWSLLSRRAIAAVAVVQFLRAVAGEESSRPVLRATFMFDDPNLRWRSYGFLRYQRLVQHADEHGYHAAMAMVPADAGRAPQRCSRRPGHDAAARALRTGDGPRAHRCRLRCPLRGASAAVER
jgi:GNAT superfamily N-acetyltransferase